MIDPAHDLSITKQAEALNISRGSVYYLPRLVPDADLAIMRRLDRPHLELPFAGSRMLQGLLVAEGHVWTAPAVQEESDLSAKRSGAAMYPASHDGISVKS